MTKENARQYIKLLEALADGELEINSGTTKNPTWIPLSKEDMWLDLSRYRRRPKPVMVPLAPEDVPPGSAVRIMHGKHWSMIVSTEDTGVHLSGFAGAFLRTWKQIAIECEISRDGGKTWQRCEKEVKQ